MLIIGIATISLGSGLLYISLAELWSAWLKKGIQYPKILTTICCILGICTSLVGSYIIVNMVII